MEFCNNLQEKNIEIDKNQVALQYKRVRLSIFVTF